MDKIKILHIVQDEKFINAARFLFENAFPGSNDFLLVKPPANPPLKYVKPWEELRTTVRSNDIVEELLNECEMADIVVLHGIDKLKGALVLKSSNRDKFLGIIYGAEIYNERITGTNYLGKKTVKLEKKIQKQTSPVDFTKNLYRKVRYWNVCKDYEENIDMRSVFSAIRVYGAFSESSHSNWADCGLLDSAHQTIPFSYYPVDYIVKDPEMRVTGKNILLGNSASATNNHLEALEILKKMDLNDRRIIVPLSYGDPHYAKQIIKIFEKRLSENFEPVTDFLPLNTYNKLISECGIVVMNHYRAQGVGNLVAALYMGARVYVNDTDAYRFFKQIGCHIHLINEELNSSNTKVFDLLSGDKIKENREALENHLSERVLVKHLKEGFKNYFANEIEVC